MAKCQSCGNQFQRSCSCQGNTCPACKKKARSGGRTGAQESSVRWQVSYRDGREPTIHDSYAAAHKARKAAVKRGVFQSMKTVSAKTKKVG